MTKSERNKILSNLKKLRPWIWYPVSPKDCTRDELIEILKDLIDEGTPYQIRGDWQGFRLETENKEPFSWQKIDPFL